ncbi:MAG: GNAT family N-acetyltransferase [Chitinophagaceae bacterium]|nr:GNAT family N-acetyltransferase [Chitinophagaceae bacterium]MCW5903999.1 GNAT family N-acetyltransferase [Chitinophagaceae bacterium]
MQINVEVIETERLILNRPTEKDIKKISAILNNEIYAKNTINIPFPYTENDAKFWLDVVKEGWQKKNKFIFTIRLKENNTLIGAVGLTINSIFNKAELGYWLDEKYWNKGFATEAVKAIIQFGFTTLNLKRIFSTHFDFNNSSGKVMQKAGMKKEGILYCHTYKNGAYQNHILYAIINEHIE